MRKERSRKIWVTHFKKREMCDIKVVAVDYSVCTPFSFLFMEPLLIYFCIKILEDGKGKGRPEVNGERAPDTAGICDIRKGSAGSLDPVDYKHKIKMIFFSAINCELEVNR